MLNRLIFFSTLAFGCNSPSMRAAIPAPARGLSQKSDTGAPGVNSGSSEFARRVAPTVAAWVGEGGEDQRNILIRVRPPEVELDFPAHRTSGTIVAGEVVARRINGHDVSQEEAAEFLAQFRSALQARTATRNGLAVGLIDELAMDAGAEILKVDAPVAVLRVSPAQASILLDRHLERLALVEFDGEILEYDDLTSALQAIDIDSTAISLGYNGTGVGVWMNDGSGVPDETNAAIDAGDFTMVDDGGDSVETHATMMAANLMGAAADAELFWAAGISSCRLRSDVDTFGSPTVYVSSLSANSYSGDDTYTVCSEEWDEFVYDTRITHFQAGGNTRNCNDPGGQWIADRAKGYNVISVGGFDDTVSPNVHWSGACWEDPETQASKPEIVAPSFGIATAGFSGTNGTSHASPIAAGVAASLMEPFTHLRLRPELVKAYLMTGAREMNTSNPTMVKEKEGAGRVNFAESYYNGSYVTWSGGPSAHFNSDTDGDGKKDESFTTSLNANTNYRIVISWLVKGSYVGSNLQPNFNFDLQVRNPSGTVIATSSSSQQSFEAVEFIASTTGSYTITIDRTWYHATAGDLALAYHLSW